MINSSTLRHKHVGMQALALVNFTWTPCTIITWEVRAGGDYDVQRDLIRVRFESGKAEWIGAHRVHWPPQLHEDPELDRQRVEEWIATTNASGIAAEKALDEVAVSNPHVTVHPW